MGRHPRPEDVANLLCGPVVDELTPDNRLRTRIIAAAIRQKELFIQMVEEIIGRKEELERERQRLDATPPD